MSALLCVSTQSVYPLPISGQDKHAKSFYEEWNLFYSRGWTNKLVKPQAYCFCQLKPILHAHKYGYIPIPKGSEKCVL